MEPLDDVSLDNVADLRARGALAPHRLEAYIFVERANTGSVPLLLGVRDGAHPSGRDQYWSKWPGNPHGNQSLVHEWVVARLGQLLDAPVCIPALIDVDPAVVQGQHANGVPFPSGVYFGSRRQTGVETQEVDHVRDDGNPQRFARLVALWELCLGQDAQYLYCHADDDQVWSLDHGMWFNSLEGPWSLDELTEWKSLRWDLPPGKTAGISESALRDAAASVESIDESDVAVILSEIPLDWGVRDDELTSLGRLILARRRVVSRSLLLRAQSAGMGR